MEHHTHLLTSIPTRDYYYHHHHFEESIIQKNLLNQSVEEEIQDTGGGGVNVFLWLYLQPKVLWPTYPLLTTLLLLLINTLQRKIFGPLRTAEQDNLKDTFWNLVFYKVVFVFGVVNVQDLEEVVGWSYFVSVVGFLQLARQLCHERHNYLILMNDWSPRGTCRRHRILALLVFILLSSLALSLSTFIFFFGPTLLKGELAGPLLPHPSSSKINIGYDFNFGLHSAIFMLCELGLLVIQTMHTLIVCVFEQVRGGRWEAVKFSEDKCNHISHLINFRFDLVELLFDLMHHLHTLICMQIFLSMTSLIVSLQMRNRVKQIHNVLKKRQSYVWLSEHISKYPHALIDDLSDEKCAICWDALTSQKAKELPCRHIFHTCCLRQWLLVSMNCPTCRLTLVSEKDAQYRAIHYRHHNHRHIGDEFGDDTPTPIGLWGFLQTGQALLDLFGGWDPHYNDGEEGEEGDVVGHGEIDSGGGGDQNSAAAL